MKTPAAKKLYDNGVSHPAVFSEAVLPVLASMLGSDHALVLDPFAGVGRVHRIRDLVDWDLTTVGVELEPEWAELHPATQIGSALALDFTTNTFDAVVTSPTYGNRLADHHNAKDGSVRRSYTHDIGRKLDADNAGLLHWGDEYRQFHVKAWTESRRVIRPGGRLVLNISDHIRRGERQYVASWHTETLLSMDFRLVDVARVETPRLRQGANRLARVSSELVLAFDLDK